jgi:putative tryptophan/tyrosine transport system substrate-binding protein
VKRRDFMTLLGGAVAVWPLAVRAQQSSVPTVGVLYGGTSNDFAYLLPSFRRGLRESGYIESRNVTIDHRWAENRYDRVPTLAEELVQRQVDVIVAIGGGGYVAKIAKATTPTIPIVFTTNLDPGESGLVASLNKPGGNATGMSFFGAMLEPKKLELMHELTPKSAAVAVLVNPSNPNTESIVKTVNEAGYALGRNLIVVTANTEHELEPAYTTIC